MRFLFNTTSLVLFVIIPLVFQPYLVNSDLGALNSIRSDCFQGTPSCTLLLGRDKKIGCAQCEEEPVSSGLRRLDNKDELESFLTADDDSKKALIIPKALFTQNGVLRRLREEPKRVAFLLIRQDDKTPANFSTDLKAPNSPFIARGGNSDYEFNIFGDGSAQEFLPFNVFHLNKNDSDKLLEQADRFNAVDTDENAFPRFQVESRGYSWSCPKSGSKDCLEDGTCHPIGGRSVWAVANGWRNDSAEKQPVLAVSAPMDSTAFFHDFAFGVRAEISALATLMAVVEGFGNYQGNNGDSPARNVAFFAFNTEAWGFSGSGRFLKDVKHFDCKEREEESNATSAKGGSCKDPVMDSLRFKIFENAEFEALSLGSLGNLSKDEENLNLHSNADTSKDLVEELVASTDSDQLLIRSGTEIQPIRPLTSAQSFARYIAKDTTTISVADYWDEFTNKYYHSQFDKYGDNLPFDEMKQIADAITRTLIRVAYDDPADEFQIGENTVADFVRCFSKDKSWNDCKLAKEYLGEKYLEDKLGNDRGKTINAYPGIFLPFSLRTDSKFNQANAIKEDLIKAFMAYHTRIRLEEDVLEQVSGYEKECEEDSNCYELRNSLLTNNTNNELSPTNNTLCVKTKCIIADAFLHNAYGPGLESVEEPSGDFHNETKFRVVGDSTETPQEAAWTESFWDGNFEVCHSTRDSRGFEIGILFAGISVFAASLGLTVLLNFALLADSKVSNSLETNGVVPPLETPDTRNAPNGVAVNVNGNAA